MTLGVYQKNIEINYNPFSNRKKIYAKTMDIDKVDKKFKNLFLDTLFP